LAPPAYNTYPLAVSPGCLLYKLWESRSSDPVFTSGRHGERSDAAPAAASETVTDSKPHWAALRKGADHA